MLGRAGENGPWRVLAGVRGNHQRVNRVPLPGEPVTALRVHVLRTNEEEPTAFRSEHLAYWQRDGRRELLAPGPRGARIYQITLEGDAPDVP
ncbi:hypothetical protein ABZ897_58590 [Nonomuraea sp. NPDC046802]|uniref:hypothetical protein n=1 Tax=Nonomuraea sp. NPDC046802 TaxID=3154919 RepID=UPI0033F0E099